MDGYAGHAVRRPIVDRALARRFDDARRDLGWSRFAASAEVHVLPGNHVTLITRHVAELAGVIRETIARALAQEA